MTTRFCPVPKLGVSGKTRRDDRAEQRAAEEQHWRDVCRIVDRRDGHECRVCERRCSPTALDMLQRAERHHVLPRGAGGPDETWNLLTLCKGCHEDKHVRGTLRLTGNADERNEIGRLAGVKVERLLETGWMTEAFV